MASPRDLRLQEISLEMQAKGAYDARGMVEWARLTFKDKSGKPLSQHQACADVKTVRDKLFAAVDARSHEDHFREMVLRLDDMIFTCTGKDKLGAMKLKADLYGMRKKSLVITSKPEAPLIFQQYQDKLLTDPRIRELVQQIDEIQGRLDDLNTSPNPTPIREDGVPLVQDALLAMLPPTPVPEPPS